MNIEFNINGEDLFAFEYHNLCCVDTFGFVINRLIFSTFFTISIYFLLSYVENICSLNVTSAVVAFIILFFSYPCYKERKLRKKIESLYRREKDKTIFGQKHILISENGFEEKSSYREEFVKWSEINSMWETHSYFFIYFSAMNALIIPKRALPSAQEFIKKVNDFTVKQGVDLIIKRP